MATTQDPSQPVPIGSYDTALCIVPPRQLWPPADCLRALYDKAYEKWPPHLNLIYPFVQVDDLARASELIVTQLKSWDIETGTAGLRLRLDTASVFPHKHENTIFICDRDESRISGLKALRSAVLGAMGHADSHYEMHMTVGQSKDTNSAPHKYLLQKTSLLPPIEWAVDTLHILVRQRTEIDGNLSNQMKVWGTIDLSTYSLTPAFKPVGFYDEMSAAESEEPRKGDNGSLSRRPYVFLSAEGRWVRYSRQSHSRPSHSPKDLTSFKIASYNVLAEFHYPPSQARYPIITGNILHNTALADVLILQEVTDDFLSYVCNHAGIREHYAFISHGPPDQIDIEPLPSHLNVVALSKWPFSWDWVSFHRRHKGSVVLQFEDIGKRHEDTFTPAILATVHLTCGLTDGSVASKKLELQSILDYLKRDHPQNPWILVGDFNLTTSAYTIEAALKNKAVSTQTVGYLNSLEKMLTDAGFVDSWTAARVQFGDSSDLNKDFKGLYRTFEGEQGATFDPTVNELAAKIVGSGFNNRPQRYDRILVKGHDAFSVDGFNMFGQAPGKLGEGGDKNDDEEEVESRPSSNASDHWGVRCSLKVASAPSENVAEHINELTVPVMVTPPSNLLDNMAALKECLSERGVFPSAAEITKREAAFDLLNNIILDSDTEKRRGNPSFVVVPVGSYGLGVWTESSDIDCLCIGPISSKTFFTLATQRLRRAAVKGVKIVRRVNAQSGTMLELEVQGIKMDLQYCPSTFIAETWPYAMQLSPADPVFSLSTQILAKLKPVRDLFYMRRTLPDPATFRTAYYLVRYWAKRRGIFSAKFGYLGGIHISVLLSRVHKMLSHDGRPISVPTILTTFFNHYANFDWKNKMVFDPFFHKRLRYLRTTREPMVILGFHGPNLNTAHAASRPSVRTISEEFKRADALLSHEGMTWSSFLGRDVAAEEFLTTYRSYVKIDAQFWGVSLAKGSGFVGWLESRCVALLVDLNRRLPNIHARIWPERFVARDASEEDTDYQGYYLIGLGRWENTDGQPLTKEDMKIATGSLQSALQRFESQTRNDEKYFDPKSCWMSASVARQSELGDLRLDTREWGQYTVGEDESDDDEEVEEEEEEEGEGEEDFDTAEESTARSTKAKKRNASRAGGANSAPLRPSYTGRFRSSADVINRLRWDPALDSADYVVGYEDRFLGVRERDLDAWKSEQTDDEFIPQHRILYFRRRGDGGVRVWDRRQRRDLVFGSGVTGSPGD
ncbi:hypothetical protein F4778DRAFT_744990 [Xylariomycetidae sp. FL2044]|nr:hypothetical protein F4778DRAFT_744990 [Xylariomycetidae sp. FL2044]